MRFIVAFVFSMMFASSSWGLSISAEIERGFRFFKYNSDFEFQRLAFREYQEQHAGKKPSILDLDGTLNDLDWWYRNLSTKTSAWYGHRNSTKPIELLREWRRREISRYDRAAGYLELSDNLESQGLMGWEYHPARLGWSSLLFPAHQKPEDLGRPDLESGSKVAVCWNRAEQGHTNCGGLNSYINPDSHTVFVRAIDDTNTRILDGQCTWQIDDTSGAKFDRPDPASNNTLSVTCDDDVAIIIPTGKEAAVTLQAPGGQATTKVAISDVLVVGVGDSFSSGEGNPDVPAKLSWTPDRARDWAADGNQIFDSVTSGPARKAVGDYYAAQWIDRACHRSAYSYQMRAALHLALEKDDRAITFLGYACSGAEINEGLFQPYQGPEYSSAKANVPSFQQAQLSLLLSELCQKYNGDRVLSKPLSRRDEMQAIKSQTYRLGGKISDTSYRCWGQPAGSGFKRPIDLLYVSIGGNDLGFSSWIMAAITSENFLGSFLPILEDNSNPVCTNHQKSCRETRDRWTILKARDSLLRNFVDTRLAFSDRGLTPVLFLTYPVPVYGSDGSLCPGGNAGLTVLVNRPNAPEPRVCLTRTEGNLPVLETITRFADSKLNGSIEELVSDKDESGNSRPAWLAVTKYQGQFMDRGFCASKVREYSNNTAPEEPFAGCKSASDTAHLVSGLSLSGRATQETLHLPVVSTNGPEWRPFDPVVDYRPYHHRSRLLRTMNETYFLVNQLARGSQQSKASGLLSLRTTAVSGAFHPTAEAHSIFADEFLVESEGILQRPLM